MRSKKRDPALGEDVDEQRGERHEVGGEREVLLVVNWLWYTYCTRGTPMARGTRFARSRVRCRHVVLHHVDAGMLGLEVGDQPVERLHSLGLELEELHLRRPGAGRRITAPQAASARAEPAATAKM